MFLKRVDFNIVASSVYTDCGNYLEFYKALDLDQSSLNITISVYYNYYHNKEIGNIRNYDVQNISSDLARST